MFSQVRGTDSTGIASVTRFEINKTREIKLAKDVGPPYYLWDTKSFDRVFYGTNLLYIGHNRSRTVGEANRKNAHPFLFDNILGAHNGTLDSTNKNRLDRGADFRTDSEAVFNNIEVHGIEDTIGRIEKFSNGSAYALTWYDRKDNSLNFLRNEDRPLWYVYANDKRTLFWASEYEILMAALHRNQIKLDEKAYIAAQDTHLKWIIPESEHVKLPEPVRAKYENKKTSYGVQGSFFQMGGKNGNTESYSDYYPEADSHLPWANNPVNPEYIDPVVAACSLPQDRNKYLDNVTAGIDALRQKSIVVNEAKTIIPETKTMSPDEFTRRRKFDETKSTLLEVKPPARLPQIWRNSDMMVHRNSETGQWLTLRWEADRGEWSRYLSDIAPKELPYTILHTGSHCFEHQGKKEKKKVFYKGFKKSLLTQDAFNKFMEVGCMNCDRHPEWGNEVAFLDHEHHFLCEHCSKTPHLIDDLIRKCKKADVG